MNNEVNPFQGDNVIMSTREERQRWLRQIVEDWVARNPYGEPLDLLRNLRDAGFVNTTVSSVFVDPPRRSDPPNLDTPPPSPPPRARINGVFIVRLPPSDPSGN